MYRLHIHVCSTLPSLFDGFSSKKGPKNWIQGFFYVLDEYHFSCFQGSLHFIQVAVSGNKQQASGWHHKNERLLINTKLFDCSVSPPLAHADNPQLLAVFVFDPLDALQLRIHDERPSLAGSQDGGVLCRHPVGGQPFILPRRDVCIVCQHGQGVQVWC